MKNIPPYLMSGGLLLAILAVFAIVGFLMTTSDVNTNGKNILELKDVSGFTVLETTTGSGRALQISGLDFNSGLVTDKIYTSQNGNILNVRISQAISGNPLSPKNASGRFNYIINLPASVTSVTFGNEETPIWPQLVNEKNLVGNWRTSVDNGFQSEIDFAVDPITGKQTYRSYYNQKPAASGIWNLESGTLTVTNSPDDSFKNVVVSNNTLHMTNTDGVVETYTKF
jgi:hypothetical protein